MGLLDTIKDRLQIGGNDDYYYDDEDAYYDDELDDAPQTGGGLLGQSSRPEAPSMSVYSHSTGRPVGETASRMGEGGRASSARSDYAQGGYSQSYTPAPSAVSAVPSASTPSAAATLSAASTKLPPYVIKPTAYEDVQSVIRRVRTGQPVVLSFTSCKVETAKRILDFCFGLACGLDGSVEELGDRAFVVLPAGASLSEAELDKLVADGILSRR